MSEGKSDLKATECCWKMEKDGGDAVVMFEYEAFEGSGG